MSRKPGSGGKSDMDRIFLRLGPNGALGADRLQWILYRLGESAKGVSFDGEKSWGGVSFIHSTKAILERCIHEKGIELSPEGAAALAAFPATYDVWKEGMMRSISEPADGVGASGGP